MICHFLNNYQTLSPSAFVAPGAVVIGDVSLGDLSSVWYHCVLRADIERIVIGEGSNIQDGSVIHLSSNRGTAVGSYVTVGHKALLHACDVEDECLIGMGAVVMDEARIGPRSIVGAGALVTRGLQVPEGSLVLGSPAKVVKQLTLEEQQGIRQWALKYIQVAAEHREKWQK